MSMFKEAEELAKAMAGREMARHKMRSLVRGALADKELTESIRAQIWLESDASKVSLGSDGKLVISEPGLPLGYTESEIKARLQRRLFPDDADRESHSWAFDPEDE